MNAVLYVLKFLFAYVEVSVHGLKLLIIHFVCPNKPFIGLRIHFFNSPKRSFSICVRSPVSKGTKRSNYDHFSPRLGQSIQVIKILKSSNKAKLKKNCPLRHKEKVRL